jgi:hypothetical protein
MRLEILEQAVGRSQEAVLVQQDRLPDRHPVEPLEIKVHPVRIASGNWTAVMGVMTGTFTEPMPKGDGTFIEPTGNRFELNMATIGFWQDGLMVHEWLFWDNATYAAQLGLTQ